MNGKLGCSALGCAYNANGSCSANTIYVNGEDANTSNETQCETFVEKGFVNTVTNLSNVNLQGGVRQLFNRNSNDKMSPDIKCKAEKCIHNENEICQAGYVVIYGPGALSSESTQCETFVRNN